MSVDESCAMGGQLVFTANLPETFEIFYRLLASMLEAEGHFGKVKALQAHIASKRKSVSAWVDLSKASGLTITSINRERFTWTFSSGTAFLSHWFIRLAFLAAWRDILPEGQEDRLLGKVEEQMNLHAIDNGAVKMNIPFVCIAAKRG